MKLSQKVKTYAVACVPFFLLTLLALAPVAFGGTQLPDPKQTGIGFAENIGGLPEFFALLKAILGWMLAFSILLAVVFIILGGIMYVTAGGSTEKASTASKYVGFSLVGVAVMILAWALVNIVANIFSVDIGARP